MFVLHADKTKIDVLEKEVVTTGSVNVYQCKISFSEDWNDLVKTAVFKVGSDSKSVLLTDVGEDEETGEQFSYCTIPATILDEYNRTLYIGLYGILGDEIILPTIWQSLGTVREGVIIGDITDGGSDGNTIHDQILAELSKKGDNIEYDRTSSTLSLKSGETVLSSVTIMEGSGSGTGSGGGNNPTVSGVISFNGRTGAVRPYIGDYTAEMVGALPDDTFIPSTADDVGADPAGTAAEQTQILREEVESQLDDKISSSGGTMVAPLNFTFGDNASVQVFSARDVSPTGSISMGEDGLKIESSNKSVEFSGSSLKNVGVAIEENDAVPYKQMQEHTKTVVETAVENVEVPTKVSELENDAGYATETYVNDVLSGIEGGGGVVGTPGKDGKSAYEIAVENGFVGTEEEWLESLKGQPGENGEPGTPGKDGAPGENGFSPTVSVTETDDGHTVSITDVDGTKSFEVLNGLNGLDGKDGTNGTDGVDGVSPTVNIEPTAENDGTVVTITDADGEKSFTILNGENGQDGTDLQVDDTLSFKNDILGVTTPVKSILTQDEFDALSEEDKSTGMYVIKDDNSDGSGSSSSGSGEIYSTEETRIGTWIDGKPLYRKVIVTNMSETAGDSVVATYDENFTVVRFEYYFDNSTYSSWLMKGNLYLSTGFEVVLWVQNNTHQMVLRTKGYTKSKIYIIIEYTKTTD